MNNLHNNVSERFAVLIAKLNDLEDEARKNDALFTDVVNERNTYREIIRRLFDEDDNYNIEDIKHYIDNNP